MIHGEHKLINSVDYIHLYLFMCMCSALFVKSFNTPTPLRHSQVYICFFLTTPVWLLFVLVLQRLRSQSGQQVLSSSPLSCHEMKKISSESSDLQLCWALLKVHRYVNKGWDLFASYVWNINKTLHLLITYYVIKTLIDSSHFAVNIKCVFVLYCWMASSAHSLYSNFLN